MFRVTISANEIHPYHIENSAGFEIGVFRQGCQKEAELFVQAANDHARLTTENTALRELLEEATEWIRNRECNVGKQPAFLDNVDFLLETLDDNGGRPAPLRKD